MLYEVITKGDFAGVHDPLTGHDNLVTGVLVQRYRDARIQQDA